jgi:hypothetical protein
MKTIKFRQLNINHDQISRDHPTDIVMSMQLGADDFIQKPFHFDVLIAKLQSQPHWLLHFFHNRPSLHAMFSGKQVLYCNYIHGEVSPDYLLIIAGSPYGYSDVNAAWSG